MPPLARESMRRGPLPPRLTRLVMRRSLDDPELISHLEATQTALTVCPCSNLCLKVGVFSPWARACVRGWMGGWGGGA